VLEVEPHEFFRRDGADLVVRVQASMSLAMRGGALSVPGLDEELRVEVPAGLRPGQRLRLAGHGLPRPNGDGRGDLVAEVELSDPRHAGLRRLLQEFVDPSSGASGE
jgi:DnaJ-class molecular chaperone